MMRFIILALIFLTTLFVTALVTLPLGFALQRSGLTGDQVSWTGTQGTPWNGRVVGLTYKGQTYGDMRTRLRVPDILRGQLAFDVRLQGAAAKGLGTVRPAGLNALEVTDVQLELDISAFQSLEPRLRDQGGHIKVQAARVSIDRKGCVDAAGDASSDVLTHLAATLGQSWPAVSGKIMCDAGTLVIPFDGAGPAGEKFSAQARFGAEVASVDASISNADAALGYALGTMGFKLNNGKYTRSWVAGQASSAP